jgi:hypothetical protein
MAGPCSPREMALGLGPAAWSETYAAVLVLPRSEGTMTKTHAACDPGMMIHAYRRMQIILHAKCRMAIVEQENFCKAHLPGSRYGSREFSKSRHRLASDIHPKMLVAVG